MWSGLDVLLLAVGITSAEMGSLTEGIGRSAIKSVLGSAAYKEYNVKQLCDGCIRFDLKMDDGFYIMIAHCALSLIINLIIDRAYYSAFDEEGAPLAGTVKDCESDDGVSSLGVNDVRKGKELHIAAKNDIL